MEYRQYLIEIINMFYYMAKGKQRESLVCKHPSILTPTPLPLLSPY